MTQTGHEQWVRIFDVPETKLHQDGFTVYKIVSTLLHRSFPEASTSLEVWRRYSTILKLHKEIIKLQHYLKLPENPPPYNKPSIVKRFDGEVIEARRKCTLILLNYCAKYPSIYASEQFTLFFKEDYAVGKKRLSFSKQKNKKSSASLAASLGISEGNGDFSLYAQLNENTSSSEDLSGRVTSVREGTSEGAVTLSLNESASNVDEKLDRVRSTCPVGKEEKLCPNSEGTMANTNSIAVPSPGLKNAQKQVQQNSVVQNIEYNSRCYSIEDNSNWNPSAKSSSPNFLTVDSSKARKKDVRKRGTAGYLQRAEKLISKFSLREGRRLQSIFQEEENSMKFLKSPSCDLNNYRVVGSSGNIIVAVDLTNQETVGIKVIEKSSNPDGTRLYLPRSVPFMVPIIRYHETEFAYYLILKFISGGKLWNHLKKFIKQPLSDHPRCESSSKCSSTYEGQRLIFEEGEEAMLKGTEEENDSSLQEYFDLSDKEARSISFGSNLAVAECRSSVDRYPNSRYRVDADHHLHHQSSMSNIIDLHSRDEDSPRLLQKDRTTPQGKCKSLDELNSSRRDSPKDLNGERDGLLGKLNEGRLKLYKDNESIGSDTLSGVSEDFSCSSLNPVSDNDNMDIEKSSTITSYSWPKVMVESTVFDVGNLIENSKKLINDVNKTLARSKQQIIRTFSTPKDLVSVENSVDSVSCYDGNENSDFAATDVDTAEPASVYLSATSNSENEKDLMRSDPVSLVEPGSFSAREDFNGASALPEDIPPSPLNGPLKSSSDHSSFNNDSSVPFLFENTQHSSSFVEGNYPIPEGLVRVWASQVIMALDHLHKQDIIWGDLNPSNLLLDDGGSILVTYKYSTYNLSCFKDNELGDPEQWWLLSLGYKAPELLNPVTRATNAADWWSVGALLYHLLTGKDVASCFPCGVTSHTQISFATSVSEDADSLISNLLCALPMERLGSSSRGVQEIKEHPFFFGIEWPA